MTRYAALRLSQALLVLTLLGCSYQDDNASPPSPDEFPLSREKPSLSSINIPLSRDNAPLASGNLPLVGTVFDEAGVPVSDVEVRLLAHLNPLKTKTDENGQFSFPGPHYIYMGALLFANRENGAFSGLYEYKNAENRSSMISPIELHLKSSKKTVVHVVDASARNIEGAIVKSFLATDVMSTGRTNSQGLLELRYPDGSEIRTVVAFKSGDGFDYFNNYTTRVRGSQSTTTNPNLPQQIGLTLKGSHTLRIRAEDTEGNVVPNETFYIEKILKSGPNKDQHVATLDRNDRDLWATTDKMGIAEFPWFPMSYVTADIELYSRKYAMTNQIVLNGEPVSEAVTAVLTPRGNLIAKVTYPDGTPGGGINIRLDGNGRHISTSTADSGVLSMHLDTDTPYVVWVDDKKWTSPIQTFKFSQQNESVKLIVPLSAGTLVHGSVTIGKEKAPVRNRTISIESISEGREKDDMPYVFKRDVTTNSQGQYQFRLPPGKYRLTGPSGMNSRNITVENQPELVHDIYIPLNDKGFLEGVVIVKEADQNNHKSSIFDIYGASDVFVGHPDLKTTTDDLGHFRAERFLVKMVIFAYSTDRNLGGVVTISANDMTVDVPVSPTVTVTGIARDSSGKPVANNTIHCGIPRLLEITSFQSNVFGPGVHTDEKGRFEFKNVIIGEKYELNVTDVGRYEFEVQNSKRIDLGSIQLK
ncbi:hypothetical protein [Symmachiella dynata]|uniref:hypothetical protein n=1 Tax=Symmachiella dynata TaxID=2527995 RepID=UPI0030EB62CC